MTSIQPQIVPHLWFDIQAREAVAAWSAVPVNRRSEKMAHPLRWRGGGRGRSGWAGTEAKFRYCRAGAGVRRLLGPRRLAVAGLQ